MENKIVKYFGILGFVVLLLSLVSAYGIGGSYSKDLPVLMHAGQKTVIELELQNMVESDGDLSFSSTMVDDGQGIAKFVYEDSVYFVPNGQKVKVPIEINVPEDAKYGQVYTIWTSYTQVSPTKEEGGMVSFVGAVNYQFNVKVVSEKEGTFYSPAKIDSIDSSQEKSGTKIYVIILIFLILVITYFILKRK